MFQASWLTYSYVYIQSSGDTWFQLSIKDYGSELNFMPWLIHRFISLNKDWMAFMDILKTCTVHKIQAIYTTGCKIICSWP